MRFTGSARRWRSAFRWLRFFCRLFCLSRLHFFSLFDLPLLVVIFFAVARRSPVAGPAHRIADRPAAGFAHSSAHRDLWHRENGRGFGASSLGAKLDVDNVGARFLVTLFFYADPRDRVLHGCPRPGEIDPRLELGTRNRQAPCSTPRRRRCCLPCWTGLSREPKCSRQSQSSVVGIVRSSGQDPNRLADALG